MSVGEAIEKLKEQGYEVEAVIMSVTGGPTATVNGTVLSGEQLIELASGQKSIRQLRQEGKR
jgi:orotate phosphoribosyltransferase